MFDLRLDATTELETVTLEDVFWVVLEETEVETGLEVLEL